MIDWVDLCILSGIEGMLGESSLVNWLVVTFQEVLIEASCTPPVMKMMMMMIFLVQTNSQEFLGIPSSDS